MNINFQIFTKQNKTQKFIDTIFTIGIFIILLTRCASPVENTIGPSCEQISQHILPLKEFDTLSNRNAVEWITDKYQLEEKEIWINKHAVAPVTQTFSWHTENISYGLLFENEHLISFVVDGVEPRITASKILDCFGEPTFYSAYTKSDNDSEELVFHLWYPEQGLVAHYGLLDMNSYSDLPHIADDLPMEMIFTRPNTIEKMIEGGYIPDTQIFMKDWSNILKPWPGSWAKMESVDLSECIPIATRPPNQAGKNIDKAEDNYLCK